jgi:hypothetical protein
MFSIRHFKISLAVSFTVKLSPLAGSNIKPAKSYFIMPQLKKCVESSCGKSNKNSLML